MLNLTEEEHKKVSAAIAAAERSSAGEIVAVATDLSDSYHDVALHWAVIVMIGALACFAAFPALLTWWFDTLFGGWRPEPTLREVLTLLMVLAVLKFTVALLVLRYVPLRLALTPRATKERRVRRRAIAVFKAAAERRTEGRTGILIYLSMAERRAEIIGDEAITAATTPETWGEAMSALIAEVKAGRPGDGIVAAIAQVGAVLAQQFPRSATDANEIPDKLIEL